MHLKKLNKNSWVRGFTIVETLIFLAVSSAIFVSVSLLISGQLGKYQARDAMNNLESVVRGALNDVTNGYYPMVGKSFNCTDLNGSGTIDNRGTNTGCLLIGKSITFEANDMLIDTWITSSSTDSVPNSVSPTVAKNKITKVTSLSEIKNYAWGIHPTSSSPETKFYIFNTNFNIDSGNFVSGAQAVKIYNHSMNLLGDTNNKVYFQNGDRTSSLEFLTRGSLGVKVNF